MDIIMGFIEYTSLINIWPYHGSKSA